MKSFILILALAATAIALPSGAVNETSFAERGDFYGPCTDVNVCHEKCDECIDNHLARKLAATWLYFSVNLDRRIADYTLTSDFQLYSDSDNMAGITGVCLQHIVKKSDVNHSTGCSCSWICHIQRPH